MKETDQRNSDKELYIHCNCGSPHDYLYFSWWDEDKWDIKSFSLMIVSHPRTLWERTKFAIKVIFTGEEYWFQDIVITEAGMDKIERIFKEYKEATNEN